MSEPKLRPSHKTLAIKYESFIKKSLDQRLLCSQRHKLHLQLHLESAELALGLQLLWSKRHSENQKQPDQHDCKVYRSMAAVIAATPAKATRKQPTLQGAIGSTAAALKATQRTPKVPDQHYNKTS